MPHPHLAEAFNRPEHQTAPAADGRSEGKGLARFKGVMMQFIRFAAIILVIFAPIILMFVSPEVFWFLFALWLAVLVIGIPILLVRYFR